ncbi:MAG: ABC transporter permease [Thermoplasmatota archaeon]
MSDIMLEKYIKSQRKRFIVSRILKSIPIILLATFIAFMMMRIGSVDPAEMHLGRHATEEMIQNFNEKYGLDEPLHLQYIHWLEGLFHGNLGRSIRYDTPISELVAQRIGISVQLMGLAILISVVFGILSGVISALYHNTLVDYLITIQALVWRSFPDFFLGILLMLVFAYYLGVLPIGGYEGPAYLILPAFAMGLRMQAIIARLTRSSMLSVLNKDYIKTAKTKGLSKNMVIFKHALRNALIPVVTIIAMRLPWMFGGAMVTEQVFNIPGMGRLILEGALSRDFILVQSTVLLITILAVFGNLLADVAYTYVDPRIDIMGASNEVK